MIIDLCQEKYRAFAFYRLPGSEEVILMAETDGSASDAFYLSPFDLKEHSAHAIKADYHARIPQEKLEELLKLNGYTAASRNSGKFTSKHDHLILVEKAIERIKSGRLKKVVCSRQSSHEIVSPASIPSLFARMCSMYKDAFVYFFSHPEAGTWMGASPELLIQGKGNTYRTMSLAGTKHSSEERAWAQKEREEQSLVTDYITQTLSELGVAELRTKGPQTVMAGELRHLCTEVSFETTLSPLVLAKALHPTPAVAGIPLNEAISFISEEEAYDRAYYSGYCGPLTAKGGAELYVNLRCLQLDSEKSILYAGGGILEDSDPASEWMETVRKTETVLGAMEKM